MGPVWWYRYQREAGEVVGVASGEAWRLAFQAAAQHGVSQVHHPYLQRQYCKSVQRIYVIHSICRTERLAWGDIVRCNSTSVVT